jgi:hypothetical protein
MSFFENRGVWHPSVWHKNIHHSGLTGVCLTSTECSDKGGTDSGNCAAGFGTCCVIVTTTDSGTLTHNNTIIQNSDYPSAKAAGAGTFTWTISPADYIEVCAIRFDFIDVNVYGGADQYVTNEISATTDRMEINGPTAVDPPLIGGILTGQHVYTETARSSTGTTLTITTLAATANHLWRIQVKHICCDDELLPPNGCQQYFTTDTGTVSTFGYNSAHTNANGQELALQHTTMCIRQNEGFCTVAYSSRAGTTAAATSFIVGAVQNTMTGHDDCTIGSLIISGVVDVSTTANAQQLGVATAVTGCGASNFCGSALQICDDAAAAFQSSVVAVPPFVMTYITGAAEDTAYGFGLQYQQLGCDNSPAN